MQKDDGTFRGVVQVLKQTIQIETERRRVPVAVFLDFHATGSEDGLVVAYMSDKAETRIIPSRLGGERSAA